jgi:hypothetical protein
MYIAQHTTSYTTQRPPLFLAPPTLAKPRAEHRFCPSTACLTDEIAVKRVSTKADVWLLTDEDEDRTWLIMGSKPVCPHCGATLL